MKKLTSKQKSSYHRIELILMIILIPSLWLCLKPAFAIKATENIDLYVTAFSFLAVIFATECGFVFFAYSFIEALLDLFGKKSEK